MSNGTREIDIHAIETDDAHKPVYALDNPSEGGACHVYSCLHTPHPYEYDAEIPATEIRFQKGPIKEVGHNGLSDVQLAAILIDRLESFQRGPFKSPSNDAALQHYRAGLAAQMQRTRDRIARNVEGYNRS